MNTKRRRITTIRRSVLALAAASALAACSGSDGDAGGDRGGAAVSADASLALGDIRLAAKAVEDELGAPQEFFEITATPQLTNVFVVADGGSSAVPYIFVDGELQAPAPAIEGVEGRTFTLVDIDFDEATVLDDVTADLPSATFDAFSVEGSAGGFVRYVISARSAQGGVLDIVVAPSGAVIEVVRL